MFFYIFPYEMNIPEAMNNTESKRGLGKAAKDFETKAQRIFTMLCN